MRVGVIALIFIGCSIQGNRSCTLPGQHSGVALVAQVRQPKGETVEDVLQSLKDCITWENELPALNRLYTGSVSGIMGVGE